MSSRRSAARGRKPINPLLVSQEGKPGRGRLFILDLMFLCFTCTARTVTGILKKQDFLFSGGAVFLSPEEEAILAFEH